MIIDSPRLAAAPSYPSLYRAASRTGDGLYSGRRYAPGERLFAITGEVVDRAELHSGQWIRPENAIQISGELYVYPAGIEGLSINHSCRPNAGLRNDVEVISLRDIAVGEEIRIDYSTCTSEQFWTMTCHCGERLCRGEIGDFHDLPVETQRRYLGRGIVQSFIVQEIFARAAQAAQQEQASGRDLAALASALVPLSARCLQGGVARRGPEETSRNVI
jgi:uncharacterized protein